MFFIQALCNRYRTSFSSKVSSYNL